MEIKKLIELCIRNHMVGIPCDCPFYDKESGGFLERCHFRYNYPDTWNCDEIRRRMGKEEILWDRNWDFNLPGWDVIKK